jgi:zinc-ribbon domain
MVDGRRFCGHCGHQLKPAARFCSNCGNSVPGTAGQVGAAGRPGYAPTATALPRNPPPPSGSGPPGRGTPPRAPRRPAVLWPVLAGLVILVAGGGTATWFLVFRHAPTQALQANSAPAPPPDTPLTTESQSSPPPPPPPPTQVRLQGVTIGISAVNNDPEATAVAATLATYFGGIDSQNYSQAWDTYTSSLQASVPYQSFANADQTSQDSQISVDSIQHDSKGKLEANVSFQSQQAGQYGPNPGETCTNWTLDYHLVPASAASGPAQISYLIDKVAPLGAGDTAC